MTADFSLHMLDGLTLEVGPGGSVRVVTDDDARKEAGHYVLDDLQSLPDVDYTKRPTRRGSSATARKSNSSAAALGFRQGTAPAAPDPEKLIRGRIHVPLHQIVLGTPWKPDEVVHYDDFAAKSWVTFGFALSALAAILFGVHAALAFAFMRPPSVIMYASVGLFGLGILLMIVSGARWCLQKRLLLRIGIFMVLALAITGCGALIGQ
jgi:hypothetical protein